MAKLSGDLAITLFDVGLGDHILIEFPRGKIGIVDTCIPDGTDEPPVLKRLREIRKHRRLKGPLLIDFLCVTHPHEDHINGIMQILNEPQIRVKELWHSMSSGLGVILDYLNKTAIREYRGAEPIAKVVRLNSPVADFLKAMKHAKDQKKLVPLVELRDFRRRPRIGGVRIECVAPSDKAVTRYLKRIDKDIKSEQSKADKYANRISLVLHFTYGKKRVLLGADAVRANWREAIKGAEEIPCLDELFPVDVMKAPHHGATNTFYNGLWDVVLRKNALVAVSCGGGKHPTSEFVRGLPTGCTMYCTNYGQCVHSPPGRFAEDEFEEVVNNTCCGDIRIVIPRESDNPVVVQPHHPPRCHVAARN